MLRNGRSCCGAFITVWRWSAIGCWQQLKRRYALSAPRAVGLFAGWAGTFALVSLGWILFRANDGAQARLMLGSIVSPGSYRHAIMPGGFYALIRTVGLGYFSYAAAGALCSAWTDRYRTLDWGRAWRCTAAGARDF